MSMPPDLDQAFRQFIPFGAAEIRSTSPAASPGDVSQDYQPGLYEPRVHALILGYWHTIITPPMTFANLLVDVVEKPGARASTNPSWPHS